MKRIKYLTCRVEEGVTYLPGKEYDVTDLEDATRWADGVRAVFVDGGPEKKKPKAAKKD